MKKVLFTTWTVTIAYEWQKKFGDDSSTYTFATLVGCKDWVLNQIVKGTENPNDKVLWYAIEGLEHIPCDENNPDGKTYQGMIYHHFVELS